MNTPSPDKLLQMECTALCQRLRQLDLDSLARQSGFLRRTPRKIATGDFLQALLSLAAESFLSLKTIVDTISLIAGVSYSKQALQKRLSSSVEGFLAQVASALFGQLPQANQLRKGTLGHFRRVLIQDSTVKALPAALAKAFPGSSNQRSRFASMRVQFIGDLLSSEVAHLSLSSFRRNDMKAACDILEIVREGDLVLRDLGYFLVRALQGIHDLGAFFLSRYRVDSRLTDPQTGKELDLEAELRRFGQLDRKVCLGPQKLLVRLVAVPVPEEVMNLRRHKARNNRDQRFKSSKRRLFLMGWTLLVTNVPKHVWPTRALLPVYRLRWRIESIFKTWKSYLGFGNFRSTSANLVRLYAMTKLLYCALAYRYTQALELICRRENGAHPSLHRIARILAAHSGLYKSFILGVRLEDLLRQAIESGGHYEQRADRLNFARQLTMIK